MWLTPQEVEDNSFETSNRNSSFISFYLPLSSLIYF